MPDVFRLGFGKHKGLPIFLVPFRYLVWLVQEKVGDDELQRHVKAELGRRSREKAAKARAEAERLAQQPQQAAFDVCGRCDSLTMPGRCERCGHQVGRTRTHKR